MEIDIFKFYLAKIKCKTIVVSAVTHDEVPLTFPARFQNIFVDYPLGQMRVGDKLWTNWNKAPLKLWQTQLNFAVTVANTVEFCSVVRIECLWG